MDPRILLGKAVVLLYRESTLNEEASSANLVLDVVNSLKLNGNGNVSGNSDALNALKDLAVSMATSQTAMVLPDLMQTLKLICKEDDNLYESITDNIVYNLLEDEIRKSVLGIRYELSKYLREKNTMDKLDKMLYELKFKSQEMGDITSYIASGINDIQSIMVTTDDEIPGMISEIDIDDDEAFDTALNEMKLASSEAGKIKMPFQAMNRMTGGGLTRGELVIVGGLSHAGKSLATRHMFLSACINANPQAIMTDPNRKPLNVTITFEDRPDLIFREYYTILKANFDGIKVTQSDIAKIPTDEIKGYIRDKLKTNGYNVRIMNLKSDDVTYVDVITKLMAYKAQGFEVHTLLIDYVSLMSKSGLSATRSDAQIQELFRRLKDYCRSENILFISPHQLSTEAQELKRAGNKYLARDIANLGYYQDCKGLRREPELEIMVDLVHDNGIYYHAYGRGKHRGVSDTADKDKFFMIPFTDLGLLWDIHGKDTSVTRFGATRNANGEEQLADYDF